MTVIYRIFGVILSGVAFMLALSIVFALPLILSSPVNMLSAFLMISIILYSWYSLQFHRKVLQRREVVKRGLRDYVRVNGIVAMIFSVIIIIEGFILMARPQVYVEAATKIGLAAPTKNLKSVFGFVAAYGIILFVHINWTFLLMKKNKTFFK